jgi:hypothetical protein
MNEERVSVYSGMAVVRRGLRCQRGRQVEAAVWVMAIGSTVG